MLIAKPNHKHLLFLLTFVVFLFSCEKENPIIKDPITSIDSEYYEMEVTVEGTDRKGFHIFAEETFTNNVSEFLALAGVTEDQLESIVLKEAQISILESKNEKDFNMLESIELTIYTEKLGEKRVAFSDPVPSDLSVLSMDPAEYNFLPYFLGGDFMLTAQGVLQKRISGDMKLLVRVKFRISGTL